MKLGIGCFWASSPYLAEIGQGSAIKLVKGGQNPSLDLKGLQGRELPLFETSSPTCLSIFRVRTLLLPPDMRGLGGSKVWLEGSVWLELESGLPPLWVGVYEP